MDVLQSFTLVELFAKLPFTLHKKNPNSFPHSFLKTPEAELTTACFPHGTLIHSLFQPTSQQEVTTEPISTLTNKDSTIFHEVLLLPTNKDACTTWICPLQ